MGHIAKLPLIDISRLIATCGFNRQWLAGEVTMVTHKHNGFSGQHSKAK